MQQQQATLQQLARLQAQTEEIFAQMQLNNHPNSERNPERELASSNMQNSIRTRRLSSNPPAVNGRSSLQVPNANTFKGRRPASLNLSALNTNSPPSQISDKNVYKEPLSATLAHPNGKNNMNKKKSYANLSVLPPVPQSAPANARTHSFPAFRNTSTALNNSGPPGCLRQPLGPPSENLESVNFNTRQRKLTARRLSGLVNLAEARRRVVTTPHNQ